MSTQSYYKDRLGFDPREALYDGITPPTASSSPLKTSRGNSIGRTIVDNVHNHNNSGGGSNNNHHHHYDHHSSPAKKLKHHNSSINSNNNNSQGGYEDALTQFKGTMSVWNYFVENWDIEGMSKA